MRDDPIERAAGSAQRARGAQNEADASIFRSKVAVRSSQKRIDESHRTMDRKPHGKNDTPKRAQPLLEAG